MVFVTSSVEVLFRVTVNHLLKFFKFFSASKVDEFKELFFKSDFIKNLNCSIRLLRLKSSRTLPGVEVDVFRNIFRIVDRLNNILFQKIDALEHIDKSLPLPSCIKPHWSSGLLVYIGTSSIKQRTVSYAQ